MKTGTKRWLALFVALMLVVGNTIAAARACVIESPGVQHGPVQLAGAAPAAAQQHLCPPAADQGGESDHCQLARQNDAQKYSHDVQPAVTATAPAQRPDSSGLGLSAVTSSRDRIPAAPSSRSRSASSALPVAAQTS